MNKINKLVDRVNLVLGRVIPAVFIAALFQVPLMPQVLSLSPVKEKAEATLKAHTYSEAEIRDEFFGSVARSSEAQAIVEKQINLVSTRKAYPASLAVIQKHEATIKAEAGKKGVPEDVALGVALLENGGSETAVSSAGALGVFQLMPGTARSLGLTVNKRVDERRDPATNIEAGVRYLKSNFERFGDWGLATWAYHAGEGNVSKALKLYAKANHGVTLKGLQNQSQMRSYVEKHGITIHKLLSDPSVKAFTRKLSDDSAGYPYKVIATATLFKRANGMGPLQALTN